MTRDSSWVNPTVSSPSFVALTSRSAALDPASLADDRVRSTFVNMLLRYGSLSRRPAAEASVDLSSDEEQDPAQVLSFRSKPGSALVLTLSFS